MGSLISEFSQISTPEYKQIVERLDNIIQGSSNGLSCAVKWGQLTYAKDGDFHHWICAIKITRNFVGLIFHFGGLLVDPGKVFVTGASKFVRKIEYRSVDEIEENIILEFIHQAMDKLETFKANWREIQAKG
jgi:hypothetical protein